MLSVLFVPLIQRCSGLCVSQFLEKNHIFMMNLHLFLLSLPVLPHIEYIQFLFYFLMFWDWFDMPHLIFELFQSSQVINVVLADD